MAIGDGLGVLRVPSGLRRSTLLVLGVSIATTVLGYGRELLLARIYGAGAVMDGFFLSLTIVQTLHSLVFVGCLTAAVIPLFSGEEAGAEAQAVRRRLAASVGLIGGLSSSVLAAGLWLAWPALVPRLASHVAPAALATATGLGRELIWLLPVNTLTTLYSLMLAARRRFAASMAPALASVALFVAFAGLGRGAAPEWLVVASFAGPIACLPVTMTWLWRMGELGPNRPDLTAAALAPAWRLARPNLLSLGLGGSLGLLLIAHLAARSAAAIPGPGGVAALTYAYRLYEVPISVIVNPAAAMLAPGLAARWAGGRTAEVAQVSGEFLFLSFALLAPLALMTWLGADTIVGLAFGRGRFDFAAIHRTAEALRGFAPTILFEAAVVIIFRIFQSIHRPGLPVVVSIASLAVLFGMQWIIPQTSLLAVGLTLSAAFAVGGMLSVGLLGRLVGAGAIPGFRTWIGMGASLAASFEAWRLIDAGSGYPDRAALAAAGFLLVYVGSMAGLFPSRRRTLLRQARALLGVKERGPHDPRARTDSTRLRAPHGGQRR